MELQQNCYDLSRLKSKPKDFRHTQPLYHIRLLVTDRPPLGLQHEQVDWYTEKRKNIGSRSSLHYDME